MKFSVIIINYRTADLTSNCLNSLFALPNKEGLDIIVVDNFSNDGSIELIKNKFKDKIRIIKNNENLGFSKANNQGARIAKGEYLLFLNSDTIVKEDIFSEAEQIFRNNSKIGIISPRLLNSDGSFQSMSFGRFPNLKEILKKNIFRKKNDESAETYDWVSGAAIFIRRDIFEKIGGWDEKFFLYLEDVDLCWSVKQVGYQIFLDPNMSLIHLGGASLTKLHKKRLKYFGSQDYFFKKHYGLISLLLLKLTRWPLSFITKIKTKKEN